MLCILIAVNVCAELSQGIRLNDLSRRNLRLTACFFQDCCCGILQDLYSVCNVYLTIQVYIASQTNQNSELACNSRLIQIGPGYFSLNQILNSFCNCSFINQNADGVLASLGVFQLRSAVCGQSKQIADRRVSVSETSSTLPSTTATDFIETVI